MSAPKSPAKYAAVPAKIAIIIIANGPVRKIPTIAVAATPPRYACEHGQVSNSAMNFMIKPPDTFCCQLAEIFLHLRIKKGLFTITAKHYVIYGISERNSGFVCQGLILELKRVWMENQFDIS